jgi:hypothetical protein
MDMHKWHCDCGTVLESIGPSSLCLEIARHQQESHGRAFAMLTEDLLQDRRYKRPGDPANGVRQEYRVPYWHNQLRLTETDWRMLKRMKIDPDFNDARSADELAARYRNKV